jgi:hypothetical protein
MTTIIIGRELLEQALGQLICNTNNMQKGMSKSIQKLCARENAEVLERLRTALAAPATAPDELERLRKDAERYRFIRDADRSDCIWREICIYAMETLDEYVDAAMDGEATMKGTP